MTGDNVIDILVMFYINIMKRDNVIDILVMFCIKIMIGNNINWYINNVLH